MALLALVACGHDDDALDDLAANLDANAVVDAAEPLDQGGGFHVRLSTHQAPFRSTQANYENVIDYLCPQAAIHSLTIEVPWSSIESATTPGSYDFSTLDSSLIALKSACNAKRSGLSPILFNIVWSAALEGGANNATPSYVFGTAWATTAHFPHQQDMAVCQSYDGGGKGPYGTATCMGPAGCLYTLATSPDGTTSGLPVSYEAPFQTAWQSFITATIAHYNAVATQSPGLVASDLGYFRFGMSQGGEASPLCNGVWPDHTGATGTQYSKTDYLAYYQSMANAQGTANPTWAGRGSLIFDIHAVGATPDFEYPVDEAGYAIHAPNGPWGFGTNGLQVADLTNTNCASDWCAEFAMYASAGVPLYLQTLCASQPDTPPGTTQCNPSTTAPTGAGPGSTGTLVQAMPFAALHGMSDSENYLCDLFLAYTPTQSAFQSTGCWNGQGADWWTNYHTAYAQLFASVSGQ